MGRINWGRVLLGGIVAGIVINISEYILNEMVVKKDWEAAMAALGKSGEVGGSAIAVWVLWSFLLGIAAIWLYAAIRPRYGAGAGTAFKAGLAVWFLASALWSIGTLNIGLFPSRLILIGTFWGLVEIVLATMLGAWVYKEA